MSQSKRGIEEQCYDNPGAETITEDEDDESNQDFVCGAIDLEARAAYGLSLHTPVSYGDRTRRSGNKYAPSLKNLKPFRRNKNKDVLPINKAGFFSYITYSWLNPVMWKSFKNTTGEGLDVDDLWNMSKEEGAVRNVNRLEQLWAEEVAKKGINKASLLPVWFRFVRTRLFVMWFIFTLMLACRFGNGVILLRAMLSYLDSDEEDLVWGISLAIMMSFGEFGRMITFASMWAVIYQSAGRLRTAVIIMVYKKLLTVRSLKDKSVGELINITINDSQRIFEATSFLIGFLNVPISFLFSLIYGYYLLGPWTLLGNSVFLMFYPIQIVISQLTHYFKKKCIVISDNRVRRMTEVIDSIKLIKMYAWEEPFTHIITGHRNNERNQLENLNYTQSVSTTISPMVPVLAAVVTLIGHTLSGNPINATQAFTLLSMFGLLRIGLLVLPWTVRQGSEALVAFSRIKSLLLLEDMPSVPDQNIVVGDNPVSFRSATFAWDIVEATEPKPKPGDKEKNKRHTNHEVTGVRFINKKNDAPEINLDDSVPTLKDLEIYVKKGQLVGIVGAVGSGKTSLFSAIIGQMKLISGDLKVNGNIVYAAQLPWIFNATVRENILFGSEYDKDWYQQVIYDCSLVQDFEQLPEGDETEIGERGVNISGGQKQRISLARAVYSNRDVYLLDDPLSAVDVHVGRHIFENAIKNTLADKTVLLATHQLQYLKDCDHVIMLRDGQVIEQGKHKTLLASGGEYAELMNVWDSEDRSTADDVTKDAPKRDKKNVRTTKQKQSSGKLISKEEKLTGDIPFRQYKMFFKTAGGWCRLMMLFLVYLLYIGSSVFSNWWLSYWFNQGDGSHLVDIDLKLNSPLDILHDGGRFERDVNGNASLPNINFTDGITWTVSGQNTTSSSILATTGNANSTSREHNVTGSSGYTSGFSTTLSRDPITTTDGLSSITVQTSTTQLVPSTVNDVITTRDTTGTVSTVHGPTYTEDEMVTTNGETAVFSTIDTTRDVTGMTSQVNDITSTANGITTTHHSTRDATEMTSPDNDLTSTVNEVVTTTNGTNVTPTQDHPTNRQPSGNITDNPRLRFYVLIYGAVMLFMILMGVIKCRLFTKMMLRASTVLHNKVFVKVINSPMSFFDTNPPGRIINRFSKDLDEADVQLPFLADNFFQQVLILTGSVIIICYVVPWFLIAAVPILIIFIIMNKWFKVGIRQLKRLDNRSRSPVLGHITSTVSGLSTIHSFNREKQMLERFIEIVNQHSVAFNLFYYSTRWFSLRLDTLSLTIASVIAFTVVLVDHFGALPASMAGLVLIYGMEFSGYFQLTMRLKVETEARFTSVERIQEYVENLKPEAARTIAGQRPKQTWPAKGCIEFQQYSMQYRSGLPLVLKSITCEINSHEKIGIVGRTGSGKSSLAVALFRLAEPASGRILIDGINISDIGLEDLRSKLSTIPQDPVLFVGTMRYNLDPFNQYDDDAIWGALEKAHIKEKITSLPLKLESPVEENGKNFSVGERQLLCMTRALLRKSKILLLDEATAAIDTETDAKIQITIREAFNDCTLLTIAHRLNTVLDSDKIMVMDDGELIEFGAPATLLTDPTSRFNAMMNVAENKGAKTEFE